MTSRFLGLHHVTFNFNRVPTKIGKENSMTFPRLTCLFPWLPFSHGFRYGYDCVLQHARQSHTRKLPLPWEEAIPWLFGKFSYSKTFPWPWEPCLKSDALSNHCLTTWHLAVIDKDAISRVIPNEMTGRVPCLTDHSGMATGHDRVLIPISTADDVVYNISTAKPQSWLQLHGSCKVHVTIILSMESSETHPLIYHFHLES